MQIIFILSLLSIYSLFLFFDDDILYNKRQRHVERERTYNEFTKYFIDFRIVPQYYVHHTIFYILLNMWVICTRYRCIVRKWYRYRKDRQFKLTPIQTHLCEQLITNSFCMLDRRTLLWGSRLDRLRVRGTHGSLKEYIRVKPLLCSVV